MIFSDKSKIIIDNYETRSAVFIDKNKHMFFYNIHLVNKCNNKKFLKRYEHYKKVFYEKMEERFMKNQRNKEGEEQISINERIETNTDLNKTT